MPTPPDADQHARSRIELNPLRARLAVHLHAKAVSGGSTPTAEVPEPSRSVRDVEDGVTLIEDVRAYKARLAVTPGPEPVRDLRLYEDLDAKL